MSLNGEPGHEEVENELLHSAAALRSLPDGVVICDRAGIVRFINPAGARLLHIDIGWFLNRPLVDLPHGAALSKCAVGEISKVRIDNEWVRYRVVPAWSANDPSQQIGKLVLFDDRLYEVEASQKLVQVISHELRAPLTVMIGNVELLNRELLGPISVDQRQSLDIIAKVGLRLRNTINDVMLLSSIETGSIFIEDEHISITDAVQELLSSFEQRFRDRNIKLTISMLDHLPPVAVGGYTVREILSKLIDNACHYTPPGGQVVIRGELAGRQVRIDIEDTGIGISDSAKPQMFARFGRDMDNPHRPAARNDTGVGLSLEIVKELLDLHGGQIWFESTVGQGSTFSFTLPVSEAV